MPSRLYFTLAFVCLLSCRGGTGSRTSDGTDKDDGASDCVDIEGDVVIATRSDLDSLSTMRSIDGTLRIEGYAGGPALEVTSDCLEEVSSLEVVRNPGLVELSGFSSLEKAGKIEFGENGDLESVSGFDALTSAGAIRFLANPQLKSISGFVALRSAERVLVFQGKIATLEGAFEKLEDAEISLQGLHEFDDLASLPRLEHPYIDLAGLSKIHSLEGLPPGSYRALQLSGLPIVDMRGAEGVVSAALLEVTNCDSLSGFSGLGVKRIGKVSPDDPYVPSAGPRVSISANSSLATLEGLSIENVEGGVYVEENSSLVSLSGWEALTSVKGEFALRGNASLEELHLDSVSEFGTLISIIGNVRLSTCAALSFVDSAKSSGFSGQSIVQSNLDDEPC